LTIHALFTGLVFDEHGNQVSVVYVGEEPCYVVEDNGFRRHIPSQQVDSQVLSAMSEMISGHEGILSEQTAKMLGQDDIFSRALIESQLKNIDQQFEQLFSSGIPEEALTYMGFMGFKIVINIHGEVIDIEQPGIIESGEE
jgi:hypothetical protein